MTLTMLLLATAALALIWAAPRHIAGTERREDETERLRALQAEGLTIEISQIGPSDKVMVAGLGYGDEFWLVTGEVAVDLDRSRLMHGRLVTRGSKRVTDKNELEALVGSLERVRFRT
jgi:hypothetical protein